MTDPIQQIKDSASIVELISEIIPVKRSGASYLALCPFHNDTKPSMHISPSKGIFKCFSCGAGGDVFKFWSQYYQKDFKETLKDLAAKYGVVLEYNAQTQAKNEEKTLSIKLHELAADFYYQKLLADQQCQSAREYLKKRSITTATCAQFKLGYAISSAKEPDLLVKYLKNHLPNLQDQEIVRAGLANLSDKTEKIYDRFKQRLMIPIFDERSRVIGFGARLIEPQENFPKYLNSPDSDIYNKGENLYGLNFAKESIRKQDFVILVEGYFDVISLHQAGITNCVANQGTALTTKQIKQLVKFSESKNIYLCLDSDQAGQAATERAATNIDQVLQNTQYIIKVIKIPGNKDADEFIQHGSAAEFQELIKQAPYYTDYKIAQITEGFNTSDPYQKEKQINQVAQFLGQIKKTIIQNEYVKILSEKFKISESILLQSINQHSSESSNPYQQTIRASKPIARTIGMESSTTIIEQELLIIFLKDKTYLQKFLEENKSLISLEANQILNCLIDISFENPDLNDPEQKYQLLQNSLNSRLELSSLIADVGIKLEQNIIKDNFKERYYKLIHRINEYNLKTELELLKQEMKTLDQDSLMWLEKAKTKLKIEREIQNLKSSLLLQQF